MTTEERTPSREERIDAYVEAQKKSVVGALILGVLFGPIGYLYVSPLGGTIMILIGLVLLSWAPGALFILWLVAALAAPFGVIDFNQKLRVRAELMAP